MTNKEWLSTLSPKEWWDTIDWLYHVYGKRWTDSRLAIMDWLEEKHEDIQLKQPDYITLELGTTDNI